MKIAIALLVVVASLLSANGGEKPGAVQVHMYLREQSVIQGRTTAVVIEIENGSNNKVYVSNQVMVRRTAETVREAKPKTNIASETPPKDDSNKMMLQVHSVCPAGTKTNRQLIELSTAPENYEITPGKSYLLKLILPPEMLEVGKCKLDTELFRGNVELSRSETQLLDCVAAPASSVEVPTD